MKNPKGLHCCRNLCCCKQLEKCVKKHGEPTTGPWENFGLVVGVGGFNTEDRICVMTGNSLNPATNIANTNLVTASWELLQALESLGALPDGYCFCPENRDAGKEDHTGECHLARGAINKARKPTL